jgi:hypothetical protein
MASMLRTNFIVISPEQGSSRWFCKFKSPGNVVTSHRQLLNTYFKLEKCRYGTIIINSHHSLPVYKVNFFQGSSKSVCS